MSIITLVAVLAVVTIGLRGALFLAGGPPQYEQKYAVRFVLE